MQKRYSIYLVNCYFVKRLNIPVKYKHVLKITEVIINSMYRIKTKSGEFRNEYFQKAFSKIVFLLHHKSKCFIFTPSGVLD